MLLSWVIKQGHLLDFNKYPLVLMNFKWKKKGQTEVENESKCYTISENKVHYLKAEFAFKLP